MLELPDRKNLADHQIKVHILPKLVELAALGVQVRWLEVDTLLGRTFSTPGKGFGNNYDSEIEGLFGHRRFEYNIS